MKNLLFILLFSFLGAGLSSAQVTAVSINIYTDATYTTLATGPYVAGSTVFIKIVATGTHTADYAVRVRVQDFISGSGCNTGQKNITMLAGETEIETTYKIPATFTQPNATSCDGATTTGTNRYLRARIPNGDAGNTSVIDGFSGSFALPITLARFEGKMLEKQALLSFTTATETNNAYFNIERSADGVKFEPIGRVQGNGTTAQEHNYSFTDETPLSGVNYYRLHQVDFDGQSSYSKVVSVRFGKTGQVYNVYPNPATDVLKVEATEAAEGVLNIEIYNQAGALVKQMQYDAETTLNEVPVADLPAGNYIVKMMSGAEVTVEKFSKQ